jgi:hypothetical protein
MPRISDNEYPRFFVVYSRCAMPLPHDPFGFLALAVIAGVIASICATAIHYGYLAWNSWQEIALKRDMVARGYTAQEIIDVVGGEREEASKSPLPNVPPSKPVRQPAHSS